MLGNVYAQQRSKREIPFDFVSENEIDPSTSMLDGAKNWFTFVFIAQRTTDECLGEPQYTS